MALVQVYTYWMKMPGILRKNHAQAELSLAQEPPLQQSGPQVDFSCGLSCILFSEVITASVMKSRQLFFGSASLIL